MTFLSKEIFKKIRQIQITTSRTVNDLLASAYHSAFKGRGMEFEEVREYTPGDEVRSIDWNVTARVNYPYVKNFREERELTVMLIVDISASSRFGSTEQLKSELIAEIGAVLAFSAIQNNDKVGLILFSSEVEKYLPPKRGTRHVLRVIRELLVFKPKQSGTDLNVALTFLDTVQKKQGVCFILSDFICSDYQRSIAMTAKQHDLITLAISDPYEKKFPSLDLITLTDLETGQTALIDSSSRELQNSFSETSSKRLQEHQRLMDKIGAGNIPIQSDQPYVQALRKFLLQKERRMR